MIEITTEQRDALLRLIERDLRSTAKGRVDLTKRFGEHANTAALDEWAATLESIRPALSDDAEIVLVVEGWWHHNAQSGKVHDHPEKPGRNWSEPMHRLCQPVYTRRVPSSVKSDPSATRVVHGNTFGVDVEIGDMLRVMPGVAAQRVENVDIGQRSTTITLEDGHKVYCRRGGRVHIEGRPS